MADTVKITAEKRTEFGKGAARRIRRESKIPAVLYGHGADPIHLTLPGHDTMLAVKTANAVLNLVITTATTAMTGMMAAMRRRMVFTLGFPPA